MRGVTFVEIIMTLFVFLIAGSGMVGAYLASHHLTSHASSVMTATDHLQDMMERIRGTAFDSLQARFPNGLVNGGVNDYSTLVGGYVLDNEQITVTYPSISTGRVEMLVTVNWSFRGRLRAISLSTIRTSG